MKSLYFVRYRSSEGREAWCFLDRVSDVSDVGSTVVECIRWVSVGYQSPDISQYAFLVWGDEFCRTATVYVKATSAREAHKVAVSQAEELGMYDPIFSFWGVVI